MAYIRADNGVPYLRTPLTRFIELLAGYCGQPDPPALVRLRSSFERLFHGEQGYDRRWGLQMIAWAAESEAWADMELSDWLIRAHAGPLRPVLARGCS